jgi:hypothetical protein
MIPLNIAKTYIFETSFFSEEIKFDNFLNDVVLFILNNCFAKIGFIIINNSITIINNYYTNVIFIITINNNVLLTLSIIKKQWNLV